MTTVPLGATHPVLAKAIDDSRIEIRPTVPRLPRPPKPRPVRTTFGPVTRGVGGRWESILGGWPVEDEVYWVLRAEVRRARALLRDIKEGERSAALWPSFEREVYRDAVEVLALTTPRADGESDVAYGERLKRGFQTFRGRLDAGVRTLRRSPLPSAPVNARASDAPLVTPPSGPSAANALADPRPTDARPVILTRKEVRAIRKRFWAAHRRLPTDAEVKALAAGN